MRAEILRLNKFLLNIIIIFVTSFSSLCIWMTIKFHYNTSCHITLCIHHDITASYSGVHLSHKTLNYYSRCYSLAQPHLYLTVLILTSHSFVKDAYHLQTNKCHMILCIEMQAKWLLNCDSNLYTISYFLIFTII